MASRKSPGPDETQLPWTICQSNDCIRRKSPCLACAKRISVIEALGHSPHQTPSQQLPQKQPQQNGTQPSNRPQQQQGTNGSQQQQQNGLQHSKGPQQQHSNGLQNVADRFAAVAKRSATFKRP